MTTRQIRYLLYTGGDDPASRRRSQRRRFRLKWPWLWFRRRSAPRYRPVAPPARYGARPRLWPLLLLLLLLLLLAGTAGGYLLTGGDAEQTGTAGPPASTYSDSADPSYPAAAERPVAEVRNDAESLVPAALAALQSLDPEQIDLMGLDELSCADKPQLLVVEDGKLTTISREQLRHLAGSN